MSIKKYLFLSLFFALCSIFGDNPKEQNQKNTSKKNSIFRNRLYDRYIAHKKILHFGSAALLFSGVSTLLYFFLKKPVLTEKDENDNFDDLNTDYTSDESHESEDKPNETDQNFDNLTEKTTESEDQNNTNIETLNSIDDSIENSNNSNNFYEDKSSLDNAEIVYRPSKDEIKDKIDKLFSRYETIFESRSDGNSKEEKSENFSNLLRADYEKLKEFDDKKVFLECVVEKYRMLFNDLTKDLGELIVHLLKKDFLSYEKIDYLLKDILLFLLEKQYRFEPGSIILSFFSGNRSEEKFCNHVEWSSQLICDNAFDNDQKRCRRYFNFLIKLAKEKSIALNRELYKFTVNFLVDHDQNKLTDFILYLVNVMKKSKVSIGTNDTDFLQFITEPLFFTNDNFTKQPLISLQWNVTNNDFDLQQKPENHNQDAFNHLVECLDYDFIFGLKNELIFHQFEKLEKFALEKETEWRNNTFLEECQNDEGFRDLYFPYYQDVKKYLDYFSVIYNKELFQRINNFLAGRNEKQSDFDLILKDSYMRVEEAEKRAEICITLYKHFRKTLAQKTYQTGFDRVFLLIGHITIPMLFFEYKKVQNQNQFHNFIAQFFEIFKTDFNYRDGGKLIFLSLIEQIANEYSLKDFFFYFLNEVRDRGPCPLFNELFQSLLSKCMIQNKNIIFDQKQIILNDLIHVPSALQSFLDFVKKKSFDDFFAMVTEPLICKKVIYNKEDKFEPLMQFVWNDTDKEFKIKVPEIEFVEEEIRENLKLDILKILEQYLVESKDKKTFFEKLLTKEYIEKLLFTDPSPLLVAHLFNHVLYNCPELLQSLFFEEAKGENEVKKLTFKYSVDDTVAENIKSYENLYTDFHNKRIKINEYNVGYVLNEFNDQCKKNQTTERLYFSSFIYFLVPLFLSLNDDDCAIFLKNSCICYIESHLYSRFSDCLFEKLIERISAPENSHLKNWFLNVVENNKHEMYFLYVCRFLNGRQFLSVSESTNDTFDKEIENKFYELKSYIETQAKSGYIRKIIDYLLYAKEDKWIQHDILGNENNHYVKLYFKDYEGRDANVIHEIFKIYKDYGGSLDKFLLHCDFNEFSNKKTFDCVDCFLQEDPMCRWLQNKRIQNQLQELHFKNYFLPMKQLIFAKNKDLYVRKILKELEKEHFNNQKNNSFSWLTHQSPENHINDLFGKDVYFSSTKRLIFDRIFISLSHRIKDLSLIDKIKKNEQFFCMLFWDALRKKEYHKMRFDLKFCTFDNLVDYSEDYQEIVQKYIIQNCNKNKVRYNVFKKLISYRIMKRKNEEENLGMKIEFPIHTVNAHLSKSLLMFLYLDEIDQIVQYQITSKFFVNKKGFKSIFYLFEFPTQEEQDSKIFNHFLDTYWLEFYIYRKNNPANTRGSGLDSKLKQKLRQKYDNENWYSKRLSDKSWEKINNYEKIFDCKLWPLEIEQGVYL